MLIYILSTGLVLQAAFILVISYMYHKKLKDISRLEKEFIKDRLNAIEKHIDDADIDKLIEHSNQG